MSGSEQRLMDVHAAAAYTGMSTCWLYREAEAERIPVVRLGRNGRTVRFDRADLDALIDASKTTAAATPLRRRTSPRGAA